MFIQKQSVESISAYAVLHDGDNCSDHYAVSITLQSKMTVDSNDAYRNVHRDEDDAPIMWSVGDTLAYSNMCQEGLDKLDFPKFYNCIYPCSQTDHKVELTNHVSNMANVLYQAAKVCFQSKCKGFRKNYWSDDLNNLK